MKLLWQKLTAGTGETATYLIKTFLIYGFIAVSMIIIKVLIARLYGQEELGIFTYFFSVASFVFLFTSFGLPEAITQTIVRHPGKIKQAVILAGMVMVPLTILFLLLTFITPFFAEMQKYWLVFMLYIMVYSLFYIAYSIFRGRKKFVVGSAYSLLGRVLFILAIIVLGITGIAFNYVLFSLSLTLLLATLPAFFSLPVRKQKNERLNIRAFLYLAFSLFLMQVGFYSLRYVDAIMIQYLVDYVSLGLYSAYSSVTNVIRLVAYVFPVVVLPLAVTSKYKISASLRKILLLLFPLSAIVLAATYLGVPFLYGPEYNGIFLPLYLVISSSLLVIYSYINSVFVGENKFSRFYLAILSADFILSLGVNTVLNFIFISIWGVVGAPIATALTITLKILLNLYGVAELRKRQKEK